MALVNDITLGQYYPGDSFVHRLDPRTKLIATLIFMTGLLLSYSLKILGVYSFITFFVLIGSKIPVGLVLRNLRPFLWLFGITLLIHIFTADGDALMTFSRLHITLSKTGLLMGVIYSFRLALLIILAVVLTLSTSPIELTDGLDKLFAPLQWIHIPTQEIVIMLTLSLRFIPTLLEEAQRLRNAQISRGVNFDGNIIQRVKSIIPLVLPLFISAFRRADELASAMDSRCYTIGNKRTRFKKLILRPADYGVLAGSTTILILTFYL